MKKKTLLLPKSLPNKITMALGLTMIISSSFLHEDLAQARSQKAQSILKKTSVERDIGHNKKYGYRLVQGFSRRGTRSQRFEIRHGDCGWSKQWNDCKFDRARIERKEVPHNQLAGRTKQVWLGFSIFVPENFTPLGARSLNSAIQTKIKGNHMPVWQLFLNEFPRVTFSDDKACRLGVIDNWKGKWNDITIFADYTSKAKSTHFQLYRNGKLLCDRSESIILPAIAGKRFKTYLKYGIYQVFVSRHLRQHGNAPEHYRLSEAEKKSRTRRGQTLEWPFKHDWGVRLPTQVRYFDEMLAGQSRESVDVRYREAKGLPPVD